MEESIRVRFDDKLYFEKSNIVDKFLDLKYFYSHHEGKQSDIKDSKSTQRQSAQSEPEVVEVPAPLRNQRQRSSHPEELIIGDNT